MKFRLRAMFALTAVSGALFFLARINRWLPILPLVMFGPLTVVFFKRPTWILGTIVATTTVWAGVVVAAALEVWGGPTLDSPGAALSAYGVHVTPTLLWEFQCDIGSLAVTESLGGHFTIVHLSHPLLQLLVTAYGLTLQFLAWWLKRRRAKAEQPA